MKKKQRPARSADTKVILPDCKHFTGYKPCFPDSTCLDKCVDPLPRGKRILVVNLEAMGNVLVTTSLLPAIKRKYPVSTISWITMGNACKVLDHNPYLDAVYVWGPEAWLSLQAMQFDIVMNIDKSRQSCALTMLLKSTKKLGYGLSPDGGIIPLNKEAVYNYRLGLDDNLKFRINQKPNTQLLTEAMGLKYVRDEYILTLTEDELAFCARYREQTGLSSARDSKGNSHAAEGRVVVGLNTGCSLLYPNKKMTIEQHVTLIRELIKSDRVHLVLLGGPEDTERNAEIARQVGEKVISTPTTQGLRRGICYENICDIIISGDSFGMHVGIGLKKYMIVWFGVSCPQEIDLFDRGVKLIPDGLECSPCWKKECPFDLECIQMIDLERIVRAVENYRIPSRPV